MRSKDKARLDFLTKKQTGVYRSEMEGPALYYVGRMSPISLDVLYARSPRAAIDAAIRASKRGARRKG